MLSHPYKNPLALRNQGQTIFEFLIVLNFLLISVGCLFLILYWGCLYFSLRFHINESLYCMASKASPFECRKHLEQKIYFVNFLRLPYQLDLQRSTTQVFAEIHLQLPGKQELHLQRSMRFPLEKNL